LSATPNGKNHNETRLGKTKSPVELCPRTRSGGPPMGRQTSPSQKTLTAPAQRNHRASPGRIPPRSHNSLLYNCPSTTRPGIP